MRCLLSAFIELHPSNGLDVLRNGPHKAGELARDRHHDLVAVDPACRESAVPKAWLFPNTILSRGIG